MNEIDIDLLLNHIEDKRLKLIEKRKKRIERIVKMTSKELAYEDEECKTLQYQINALAWLRGEIYRFVINPQKS